VVGSEARAKFIDDFYRHLVLGESYDFFRFDFEAIVRWVEKGTAPDQIIATKDAPDRGAPTMTRGRGRHEGDPVTRLRLEGALERAVRTY
jgi:hypothetical protein